jgi:hypothetical protein
MYDLVFQKYRRLFGIITGCVFLIGVGRYFSEWPRFWDLWLWDETFYMGNGIYTWTASSFSNYEASPLYSYIYRLAHRVIDSPVELFSFVGLLGTAGAVVATAGASWLLSRSTLFGVCVGAVLVLGNFAMSGPRLIYAAIIVLVLGGALGLSMRVFSARATVLSLTTFLAAFIRPEFALAFYLFALLAVGGWLKILLSKVDKRIFLVENRLELLISLVAICLLLALSKIWSFPVIHGGDRALMAFGQHYSLYWSTISHANINAFLNWESILARELPGVNSEFQAIFKHPGQMLAFFAFNLFSAFQLCGRAFLAFLMDNYLFVTVIGVVFSCVYYQKRNLKHATPAPTPQEHTSWWEDVILWLVLAAPCLVSIILIYAREHYLVIFTALVALGGGLIVRRRAALGSPLLAAGVAVAFMLLVVPAPQVSRPNMNVVSALKAQGNLGRVLELDGGWCFYVPEKCVSRFMVDIPKGKNFVDYLNEDNIDSIVVSKTLKMFAEANGQADFLALLDAPVQHGWKKTVLTPDAYLLQIVSETEPSGGGMLAANLMEYVANTTLGNEFGAFYDKGDMTFFVHPGRETPTSFELLTDTLTKVTGCRAIILAGSMDPKVTKEAADRGAAQVSMQVQRNGAQAFKAEVSVGHNSEFYVSPEPGERINIVVGNLGNADTDWFNLKVRLSACGAAAK